MRPPWSAASASRSRPWRWTSSAVCSTNSASATRREVATLGGCKVELGNGYVTCLWKGGRTNRELEEFALRMQQETGCVIADVGGYRVIPSGELAGLNGRVNEAPAAHGTTGR